MISTNAIMTRLIAVLSGNTPAEKRVSRGLSKTGEKKPLIELFVLSESRPYHSGDYVLRLQMDCECKTLAEASTLAETALNLLYTACGQEAPPASLSEITAEEPEEDSTIVAMAQDAERAARHTQILQISYHLTT